MGDVDGRRALLHALAWACAALVLAITTLSAFLRLSHAGLGCTPWPACYAQSAAAVAVADSGLVGAARIAHRLVASLTLLLVIVLVMATLRRPDLRGPARIARGLLVLTVFLAVLGRWSGGSASAGVAWANAVAGLALFALSALLVAATRPPTTAREAAARARRWNAAVLAVAALQVALGAWVSVRHAAADCGASAACGAHRALGLLLVAAMLATVIALRRARHGAAFEFALLLVALAQAAAGVAMLATTLPLTLALAHNVLAALLLGGLAAAAWGRGGEARRHTA